MAQTAVNITFQNTVTGQAQSSDGMCLLLVHAVAVGSTFLLDTTYTLTSLNSLTALGITPTYDTTNTTTLYRQVSEFYSVPGNSGATLYLVGHDATSSPMSTYIATAGFSTLLRQTAFVGGQPSPNAVVRFLGISFFPQSTPPSGSDTFYSDVIPTRNALQLLITSLAAESDTQLYLTGFVDGNNMLNVSSLIDQSVANCPQVGIHIGTDFQDSCASIGNLLGVLAQNKVSFNIGNVALNQLLFNNAWFTDGTPLQNYSGADFNAVALKQYIFFRTRGGQTGFYYNDGPTCTLPQNSLSTIANNRVANKIQLNDRLFFTTIIGSDYVLDPQTGNIPDATLAAIDASYTSTYIQPMINNEEISGFEELITNALPNFAATKTLNVAQRIVPIGSLQIININAVFVNTLTV